jgi:hypothetical protein
MTDPPVCDQSQTWHMFGCGSFFPLGAQNHPFTIAGCRSGRSHPAKLHFRPPVQMYGMSPVTNNTRLLREVTSSLVLISLTLSNYVLDGVVLGLGVKGNRVHAEPPAVVAGLYPVELGVSAGVKPGQVVALAKILMVHSS